MANILCVDIGGTRIKAAVINDNITIEELKNTKVKTMETLGWMNSSLPQIMSKDHPASLIHENKSLENHDSIAIGVPLHVIDNGKIVKGHYLQFGVPKNLLKAFKEKANCDIVITNDSLAWIHGILKYFQLSSIGVEFPCMAIILGTGIGLAYADSYTKMTGLELNNHNNYFKNLSIVLKEHIDTSSKIHDFLGEKFVSNVKETHKSWTYLEIQNTYTERLIGLLKDFEEANICNYKDVRTIMIAGGNSKYLRYSSLKNSSNKSIYILSSDFLHVNPDLIPLMGLLSLAKINF